jgi:NADH dehydrogenase
MLLVTGGTGLVGAAIVDELLRRGEAVAVLGRDEEKIKRRFDGRVEARAGDVTRPETLAAAMQGMDTVINAVQFPSSPIEIPRKDWTFENVDYKGTVNLVDAAKASGVKRFVYLSAVGADPDGPKHWFRFKGLAEEYVRESRLEWTIVRPTWVFGPQDDSLNRIIGFSKFLPFVPLFGDGRQAMQPVFVEDVGRVVADAAMKPEAVGEVFELGGPEVMSMNDVLQTALEVMGRKRFILHQPIILGKVAGKAASLLPNPPLSADAVDFINDPAVADTTNLHRVLQPELKTLRVGLETYLGKQRP